MEDLKQPGFKTGDFLFGLGTVLEKMPDGERAEQIQKTKGIFQLNVTNSEGKEAQWVIDLKDKGKVTKGTHPKPSVTMTVSDETFTELAEGKVNGQKAFMTGKLKLKGDVMLATKLDGVLKTAKAKL